MSPNGRLSRNYVLVMVAASAAILVAVFHQLLFDYVSKAWDQAVDWGVSPVIFFGLLLGTTYHYYKGWFMIAKGVFRKDADTLKRGFVLNRITWAIPWIYVALFGHLPQKVFYIGVISLVLLFAWFAYNYRRPNYIHKMTRSPVGKLVGKRLNLNAEGEERS